MKQIICMKWGSLYSASYVNKLYDAVKRNTEGEVRFVCLTDNPCGVKDGVETLPCPEIGLLEPFCNQGWRKLNLFSPSEELFGLNGSWLYLDLDVVVTGDLNRFFEYEKESSFVVMQNWTQRGKGIGNTSVYRFAVGENEHLLKNLIQSSGSILNNYRNSQTYISRNVNKLEFWPDHWCVLFKTHCIPKWPMRFVMKPSLPPDASVVAFPGVPNPCDAVKGHWPCKWYKKIYKYIKPASWISRYWY